MWASEALMSASCICSWRGAVIEPDQSSEPPSSRVKEPEKPSSVEGESQKEPGKWSTLIPVHFCCWNYPAPPLTSFLLSFLFLFFLYGNRILPKGHRNENCGKDDLPATFTKLFSVLIPPWHLSCSLVFRILIEFWVSVLILIECWVSVFNAE